MSIQQLLFAGSKIIEYVGEDIVDQQDPFYGVDTISVQTPAETLSGDLILFFGSMSNTGVAWNSPASVTDVVNSGGTAGAYFGYRVATVSGSTTYTFTITPLRITLEMNLLVYRRASYAGSYKTRSVSANGNTASLGTSGITVSKADSTGILYIAGRPNTAISNFTATSSPTERNRIYYYGNYNGSGSSNSLYIADYNPLFPSANFDPTITYSFSSGTSFPYQIIGVVIDPS